MKTFLSWLKLTIRESLILFRNIPSIIVAIFVVSVVTMNILSNKTIFQNEFLAIDGGIFVSWIAFLTMDIVTKHFGPKASNRLSIFAVLINALTAIIFYLVSIIPASKDFNAFNNVIGGTWFILLSSTIAFIFSAILNNFLNYLTGKMFKKNPDGKVAFITRCYVSTFISQLVDNLIFSILCFMVFFPIFRNGFSWTFIQCFTCSILTALIELILEIVFSPIGYLICKNWQKNNVGHEYLEFINKNK